jgi:histidinol-phosphate aminotransferase
MGQMVRGLTALGFSPIPSEANFVYVDIGRDGRQVFEALLQEGVIVRHIEGRMVRVTIGLEEENREFLAALKRVIHAH